MPPGARDYRRTSGPTYQQRSHSLGNSADRVAAMDPSIKRLSAVDVATALRSFPRRYRARIVEASILHAASPDDLMARTAPDGTNGTSHLCDVVSTLTLVERALAQVLHSDDPALHPAVMDPTVRHWDPPMGTSVETMLEMLDQQCDDLADQVAAVHTPDWSRPGHIADGEKLTALDLAHEAVRVGSTNLAALERTLASLP